MDYDGKVKKVDIFHIDDESEKVLYTALVNKDGVDIIEEKIFHDQRGGRIKVVVFYLDDGA